MLNVDMLSFQEFLMQEPLPLATVQAAVLEFLRDRDDVVLFGAQAVNAYVAEPRMTQDVDLLALQAGDVAQELREALSKRFHIAVRVREVVAGRGYRLYQVRQGGNRHLVDLRDVETLPAARRIGEILVLEPAELIAFKVIASHQRRGKPKAGTDWRDLAMLLLAFPELKQPVGPVAAALNSAGANAKILSLWQEIVATAIVPEEDEDEFSS